MKIAVIGANGQLGSDICSIFNGEGEIIPLDHTQVEISEVDSLFKIFSDIKPDVVINTAAYHNVMKCEEDPVKSFSVNCLGSLNLAKLSTEIKFKLVHFSTDYVFDGRKNEPYVETDSPNPLNVYAASKLTGEYFIKNYCERYFILRISGIYGKVPCRAKGGNFVTNMIKFAKEKPEIRVVIDEKLTPTPTYSIASNLKGILKTDNFGLYHLTCEGECSWYEFAKLIFDTLKISTPLIPAKVKDFPLKVKRPFYSVLENFNLNKIDMNNMPLWNEALIDFLKSNFC